MRGPINYIGGKNRLANLIVERIPVHMTYVEPFSGGAQVFFHKPRSKVEVLNDLDSQLVNFTGFAAITTRNSFDICDSCPSVGNGLILQKA